MLMQLTLDHSQLAGTIEPHVRRLPQRQTVTNPTSHQGTPQRCPATRLFLLRKIGATLGRDDYVPTEVPPPHVEWTPVAR
jgi:hypothetical protein